MDLAERLWSRVTKTDTCWIWTGPNAAGGYGVLWFQGKNLRVHRLAYELTYGTILPGLDCLHHCDNPPCVRPDHLFLGTHSDNMRDMTSKGRNGAHTHPERLARGVRQGTHTHPESRPHGIRHGMAKLSEHDVRTIRELARSPDWTVKRLAQRYAIGHTTVREIIARKKWRHLS